MLCYYRDRFDVIASILDNANGNKVRQAEILHNAKIPHTLFKEYLYFLYQNALIDIEYIQVQRTYKTTAKGKRFLSIYNKMKSLIEFHSESKLKIT